MTRDVVRDDLTAFYATVRAAGGRPGPDGRPATRSLGDPPATQRLLALPLAQKLADAAYEQHTTGTVTPRRVTWRDIRSFTSALTEDKETLLADLLAEQDPARALEDEARQFGRVLMRT